MPEKGKNLWEYILTSKHSSFVVLFTVCTSYILKELLTATDQNSACLMNSNWKLQENANDYNSPLKHPILETCLQDSEWRLLYIGDY